MGAVVKVKEWQASVIQQNYYTAYGEILKEESTGQEVQPYKFGGKEQETMFGLHQYDFGARQYAYDDVPGFLSVDPLAEKDYNISYYAYCHNNPVTFTDPTGLSTHLNYKGEVVQKNDDGDDGVYVHDNLSGWDSKSILDKSGPGVNNLGKLGGNINVSDIMTYLLVYNSAFATNMGLWNYYNAVKTNGSWDLKSTWDQDKKEGTIFGLAWYFDETNKKNGINSNTTFSFSKYKGMSAADVGNYHAGYMGQAADIPLYLLWKGAGFAETKKEWQNGNGSMAALRGYCLINPFIIQSGDRTVDFMWNTRGMLDFDKIVITNFINKIKSIF